MKGRNRQRLWLNMCTALKKQLCECVCGGGGGDDEIV